MELLWAENHWGVGTCPAYCCHTYCGVAKSERPALMAGERNSTLWKALSSFAEKGYKHDGLKWHHVGTYLDGDCRKVAFTDLGRVSEIKDGTAWVEAAFVELKNRAESDVAYNLLDTA